MIDLSHLILCKLTVGQTLHVTVVYCGRTATEDFQTTFFGILGRRTWAVLNILMAKQTTIIQLAHILSPLSWSTGLLSIIYYSHI